MSKKDTHRGRPRLVCTQWREAGACDHRRVYYLDEIERRVVNLLRSDPVTGKTINFDRLIEVINTDPTNESGEAAEIVRSAIESVVVIPTARGRPPELRIVGLL
jgi:hypothetical protein